MQPPKYLAMPNRLLHVRSAWLVGSLLVGLLLLGANNEELYALFDGWWQRAVGALGLAHSLPGLLQPSSSVSPLLHQARSIPAVLLYSVLYLGLCLGLLFLLVPVGHSQRLVLFFYAGAGLATGLLLLGSQVGGGPTLAVLASQLVHFIVSPGPVIVLVPLLRWAATQQAST